MREMTPETRRLIVTTADELLERKWWSEGIDSLLCRSPESLHEALTQIRQRVGRVDLYASYLSAEQILCTLYAEAMDRIEKAIPDLITQTHFQIGGVS